MARIPLFHGLGLFPLAGVNGRYPRSPFSNSAMDGFAVRAADVAAAGEDSPDELACFTIEQVIAGRIVYEQGIKYPLYAQNVKH